MLLRVRLCLLAALVALLLQPASAQGIWDSLFGSDRPSPSRPAAGYVRTKPTSLFDGFSDPFQTNAPQPHVRSATYRTLCVRMCDGFYFPISFAAASDAIARDADKCEASCSGARLFYHPNPGGDIEGMLDMTGRAYASYPIAFRYRKTLVQGCQCRPHPWTEAEQARHRTYAALQLKVPDARTGESAAPPPIDRNGFETAAPDTREPPLPFHVPSGNPGFSAPDDWRAASRPTPVYGQSPSGQWRWFPDTGPAGQARSRYER